MEYDVPIICPIYTSISHDGVEDDVPIICPIYTSISAVLFERATEIYT